MLIYCDLDARSHLWNSGVVGDSQSGCAAGKSAAMKMLSCQYGPNSEECFKHFAQSMLQRIKVVLKAKKAPTWRTKLLVIR